MFQGSASKGALNFVNPKRLGFMFFEGGMSPVAALVEKATSDLLIGPDWGKNLELCDAVNSDPGLAKEVVKCLKKRLKNSTTVQLLALTLLETLVKNCGDAVHQQVAERDVLPEMVKLVKKKADMSVRDKVLVLLDSWQEAFGGARGRFPQYFAAYNELKQSGAEFPTRAPEELVPIFTPPQTHPITPPPPPPQAAFDAFPPPAETYAQSMSLSDVENARGGLEVLTEMLNAVDPRNKAALRDELIVELVEQCRTTQKQVLNLVNTTSDETLLFQALSLNDDLQKTLAKHDAMAVGAPLEPSPPPANFLQEEEPEDDYAQLARRSRNPARLQPAAVIPVLPPPQQAAKSMAAPPVSRQSTPSVDLLSGDMYAATVPPVPLESSPAQGISSPAPVTVPTALPTPARISSPASLPLSSPPVVDEDPEYVNPFAVQHNDVPLKTKGSGSWSTTMSTPGLSTQQEALLYGADATPPPSSTFLPPPPIKHSQRQQYFQQHHHGGGSGSGSSADEDLAARAQQSLSIDDEHMQNPYAAYYTKKAEAEAAAPPPPPQVRSSSANYKAAPSTASPSDNLFGDLVDLARMKARPS